MAAILDPAHKPSASLLERTAQAYRYAQALAHEINGMTHYLLSLDNEALENWLNSQTPQNLQSLLAVHGACGNRTNATLADVCQQLNDSGQSASFAPTDTRPLEEKLAEQGRQMSYVDGKFVVSNLPEQ